MIIWWACDIPPVQPLHYDVISNGYERTHLSALRDQCLTAHAFELRIAPGMLFLRPVTFGTGADPVNARDDTFGGFAYARASTSPSASRSGQGLRRERNFAPLNLLREIFDFWERRYYLGRLH